MSTQDVFLAKIPLQTNAAPVFHIQILTLWSTCTNGLFPMNNAPPICKAGISSGKLKGVMSATGPYGHLVPRLRCPEWSPATRKPRAVNRTLSPEKFSKNFVVMVTSARACA